MYIATLTDSVSPITAHKQTRNIIYVWQHLGYSIPLLVSTFTYRAIAIYQPPYLASLLYFSTIPRQLRASTSQQLSIPRTKLNPAKRAFSVAAPNIWNKLPTTLKSCVKSLASFHKTYLFKIGFSNLNSRRPFKLMMRFRGFKPYRGSSIIIIYYIICFAVSHINLNLKTW